MSEDINFDTLRFIRVFTPMHVPKELIEQVRDREYDCLLYTSPSPRD